MYCTSRLASAHFSPFDFLHWKSDLCPPIETSTFILHDYPNVCMYVCMYVSICVCITYITFCKGMLKRCWKLVRSSGEKYCSSASYTVTFIHTYIHTYNYLRKLAIFLIPNKLTSLRSILVPVVISDVVEFINESWSSVAEVSILRPNLSVF